MSSTAVVCCFSSLKLFSKSVQMCVLCEARCDKQWTPERLWVRLTVYVAHYIPYECCVNWHACCICCAFGAWPCIAGCSYIFIILSTALLPQLLCSFLPSSLPSILPPLLSSFIHLVLRHDLGVLQISAILMQSYKLWNKESSELIKVMSMFDLHNHV